MEESEDVFYQFDIRLNLGAQLGEKCYLGTIDNSESTCLFKKTDDGYHYEKILDGVKKIEYLGEGVYHIQDADCQWSILCLNDFETIIDFSNLQLAHIDYYWPYLDDVFDDIPKHFSTIRLEHIARATEMDYGHCYLIGVSGGREYYGFLTITEVDDGKLWYSLDVPIGYEKIIFDDQYVYAEIKQHKHLYCRDSQGHRGDKEDRYGIPRLIELNSPIEGIYDIDLETIENPYTRIGFLLPICKEKILLCNFYHYKFLYGSSPIEADSVTQLCYVCGFGSIDYYVFKIGLHYGLWQHGSGVILQCEFDEIQAYPSTREEWNGDLLLVQRKNQFGVYSISENRMIVPPLFDSVLSPAFNEYGRYIGFYALLDDTEMLIEKNGDIREK